MLSIGSPNSRRKASPEAGNELKTRNSKFIITVYILLALAVFPAGCGKEGVPLPPEIRVAERTTDLSAFQELRVVVRARHLQALDQDRAHTHCRPDTMTSVNGTFTLVEEVTTSASYLRIYFQYFKSGIGMKGFLRLAQFYQVQVGIKDPGAKRCGIT